jgi:hypothetical protein
MSAGDREFHPRSYDPTSPVRISEREVISVEGRMLLPTGRSYKRIRKEVPVEIESADPSKSKGKGISENISPRGIRVAAEQVWRPGDNVIVHFWLAGEPMHARVVYCQKLENEKFAIGMELVESQEPQKQSS